LHISHIALLVNSYIIKFPELREEGIFMLKRLLICTIASTVALSCYSASAASHHKSAAPYKGTVSYKDEMPMPVAVAPMFQPYVGINYVYYHNSYASSVTDTIAGTVRTISPNSTAPNNWSGASLDAGFKYGQYMGMEFGYYQTGTKSKTTTVNGTSVKISELQKGFYAQLMGYWPIDNWDLIGIAGATVNSLGDSTVSFGTSKSAIRVDDSVRPLLGLGVDYRFTNNIGVRGTARYSFVQSNYVNNAMLYDLGLFYMFG
jgi:hypothetical protein